MTEKANLIKGKKFWQVKLKTKKGSKDYPIFDPAKFFREEDAEDGVEVNVTRKEGQIIKVTIEGKPETAPILVTKKSGDMMRTKSANNQQNRQQPKNTNQMQQAFPEMLGEPFHNPYTFIPFMENPVTERTEHTPLSADDRANHGYLTGIIRLEIQTDSPLMSHDGGKVNKNNHKSFGMLTIGKRVVVPATAIKGFLRNLTTILSGGPLHSLDENTYLCQGRDIQIQGENGETPFLAGIADPGDVFRDGIIQLGEYRFISTLILARFMDKQDRNKADLAQLENAMERYEQLKIDRKTAKQANNTGLAKRLTGEIKRLSNSCNRQVKTVEKLIKELREESGPIWVFWDGDQVKEIKKGDRQPNDYWQLKISGRPIQGFNKKEGLFRPDGQKMTVPSKLWAEYASRNMHGSRKTLQKNDLVWLEVKQGCRKIMESSQILSLQWARWGKKGNSVLKLIKEHVKPDWLSRGKEIHPVTNIFGLGSPSPKYRDGLSVASKLHFDNLVFDRAATILPCQPIATLASPHPGCLAFYRDNPDPKSVSSADYLRGYKVYRTTKETGKDGPWNYDHVQPIYERGGKTISPAGSRENVFSSELLAPGAKGRLEIAFRSLTKDELSLLMAACSVPWRLGGGKPLGLGLCRVTSSEVINEFGENLKYDALESSKLVDKNQLDYWIASQEPVAKLRYPRAAITNRDTPSRGGHNWFSKMAKPKQERDQGSFTGLSPIYSTNSLKAKADKSMKSREGCNEHENEAATPVSGSVLPELNPNDPSADLLYGYDIHFDENKREEKKFNRKTTKCYPELKKFLDHNL